MSKSLVNKSSIKVVPVESKKDWNDFFNVRRQVYRDDPNVVFPLRMMEKTQLMPGKHPFYEHARRQAFVCYSDNQPVGRVAAVKDDLHNEHYGDRVGFFGFFETSDNQDFADALIAAAAAWLKEQGCDTIRGPVSPSMKAEFGVVVEGNDDPPFVMMGYSPKYYEELLLGSGFEITREFNAYLYDVESQLDGIMESEHQLIDATRRVLDRYPKLRIGSVNKSTIEKELREINVLANQVRSSGWGFVPLTDAELDFMIAQLKRVIVPEMLLVAYWEDRLVGYCINIP
ncbi:MAG: hypothetical protein AAGA30_15245, partial [Planctomycetota bacterium]